MSDHGSWIGISVRDKNGRTGEVIDEYVGPTCRKLEVKFEDVPETHLLTMNYRGGNDHDPLGIEWEFRPGEWSPICQ